MDILERTAMLMVMRVAQIAPLQFSVPPKHYGGVERVVSALTEELVRRGHDVTLFASGDSVTQAKLSSVVPVSLSEEGFVNKGEYNGSLLHSVGRAFVQNKEFDIVHSHVGGIGLPMA